MNRLMMSAAAAAVAAGLASCETATPYQPALATAHGPYDGFHDAPLEQNRWRVTFAGNTFTPRHQVEDGLLLRAAELTLQNGFDHFVTLNQSTDRNARFRTRAAGPGGLGYGYGSFWSRFGHGPGGYPASPYAYGGDYVGSSFASGPVVRDRIDRYEASAEILMGRGAPPADGRAYDANQIVATLGAKFPRPGQPVQAPYRRY